MGKATSLVCPVQIVSRKSSRALCCPRLSGQRRRTRRDATFTISNFPAYVYGPFAFPSLLARHRIPTEEPLPWYERAAADENGSKTTKAASKLRGEAAQPHGGELILVVGEVIAALNRGAGVGSEAEAKAWIEDETA
jgi:hypothetical protein